MGNPMANLTPVDAQPDDQPDDNPMGAFLEGFAEAADALARPTSAWA